MSPDEAFAFQDAWLDAHHLTDRNCFKLEEMNILGHPLKIL